MAIITTISLNFANLGIQIVKRKALSLNFCKFIPLFYDVSLIYQLFNM